MGIILISALIKSLQLSIVNNKTMCADADGVLRFRLVQPLGCVPPSGDGTRWSMMVSFAGLVDGAGLA